MQENITRLIEENLKLRELQKQHKAKLKEIREMIENRRREIGVGIQNYTENKEELDRNKNINYTKIIEYGETLLKELDYLLKEFDKLTQEGEDDNKKT